MKSLPRWAKGAIYLGAAICTILLAMLAVGVIDVNDLPWQTSSPTVLVPDVINLPEGSARSLMDAAGLTINVICQDPMDANIDSGMVYDTTPRFASEVERGSEVTLYIKPPC